MTAATDPRKDMFDLTGKVALVTGAGQGVGTAVAERLAERGAKVAVNDISQERCESAAAAISDGGGEAIATPADITNPHEIADAVKAVVECFGPIDILVNNAGVPPQGFRIASFRETTQLDWEPYIAINVYGIMHCTQAVIGPMISGGWGRIITIASDAGRFGEPRMAAYSASKAAASGFMRSLSKELGPSGVTCNSLSLGSIEPPLHLRGPRDVDRAGKYPTRRLGRPDDVAGAVVWLSSDAGSWVTGQTISLNGGYVAT